MNVQVHHENKGLTKHLKLQNRVWWVAPPSNENLWHSLQIHICSNPNFIPDALFDLCGCISLSNPEIFGEFPENLLASGRLSSCKVGAFQISKASGCYGETTEEVVTFRWSKSSLLLWWWTAAVEGMFFFFLEVRTIPFEELITGNTLLRISTKTIIQVVDPQQVVCYTLPLLRGLRI